MSITASKFLQGVPAKGLDVIGHYGNDRAEKIAVLTQTEFTELHVSKALRNDTYYLICEPNGDKERLTTLSIQQHYLKP
jgi:hypothetical protein